MQGFVSWFVILRIQHTRFSRYESSVFLPNRIGIFNQLGAFFVFRVRKRLFLCTQTSKMSIFDAISHKLRVSFWKKAKKVLLLARFTTNTLWGNTGNLSLKQRKIEQNGRSI